MNYIGLMNQMWRSAMKSPMPASEIALFAYRCERMQQAFLADAFCLFHYKDK